MIVFRAVRKLKRIAKGLTHPTTLPIIRILARIRMNALSNDKLNIPSLESVLPQNDSMPEQPSQLNTIPRVIFQTWKSKSEMPNNYRVWRKTFFDHNPDYKILLWDDHDNRNLIYEKFPWFRPYYDRYPREIFRVDAVRIFFLFYYGGFYADMDTECLQSLDGFLETEGVLLGRMGWDHGFEHSIPNAIMASSPRQAFWLVAARVMMERLDAAANMEDVSKAGPETFTGPILLKAAADRFFSMTDSQLQAYCAPILAQLDPEVAATVRFGKAHVLPPEEWYPVDWTNPVHRLLRSEINNRKLLISQDETKKLFPQASMITYWSHSW